jgi:hypothetical protein
MLHFIISVPGSTNRCPGKPGAAQIDVWESFARWVPHQIGARREVLVAMDWTDFDHDDQATLVLSLGSVRP